MSGGTDVAALFVETDGVYFGIDGVDPWDAERDARKYPGPYPVVAHPPCERWSLMSNCRRQRDGADGGRFEAALRSVRTYGGVLEHPAFSLAWNFFGLPKPHGWNWGGNLFDPGYSCAVDQRWYGHEARKPTWLYCVGVDLTSLPGGLGPPGERTIGRSYGGGRQHLRARTPEAFRDVLLDMARSSATADFCPPPQNTPNFFGSLYEGKT